jgi:predicted DNA-binding protein (UPF0251 family)
VLFKPQGIPAFMLDRVAVTVDEYEAVRLMDYEGLDQAQAAKRLGVSRATAARILESAHRKIAEALTQGKAISIEGGSFIIKMNRYWCRRCGSLWDDESQPETERPGAASACPSCGSTQILDLANQVTGPGRGRRGWRGGP